MGAIKTIGESALGPVRTSNYGTYSRVVMVAIDASPGAKYAFNCESGLDWLALSNNNIYYKLEAPITEILHGAKNGVRAFGY